MQEVRTWKDLPLQTAREDRVQRTGSRAPSVSRTVTALKWQTCQVVRSVSGTVSTPKVLFLGLHRTSGTHSSEEYGTGNSTVSVKYDRCGQSAVTVRLGQPSSGPEGEGPSQTEGLRPRDVQRPRAWPGSPIRSVPQHPQALRVAVSYVAPRVDPATGGEKRLAAAEHRPA